MRMNQSSQNHMESLNMSMYVISEESLKVISGGQESEVPAAAAPADPIPFPFPLPVMTENEQLAVLASLLFVGVIAK